MNCIDIGNSRKYFTSEIGLIVVNVSALDKFHYNKTIYYTFVLGARTNDNNNDDLMYRS